MRGLNDTIARLSAAAARRGYPAPVDRNRLFALKDFGSNPGNLKGYIYLPDGLGSSAPLVVVLHGCAQTADGYDMGSGWSELADECSFALLFPEQQPSNNPNRCFNWFEPNDTRRGAGEAFSIRQMIATVERDHGIDPGKIFITGLSAGGAMTSTMLATYPEVFAGGAIIAGLPHGAASSVVEAFDRMRGHALPSEKALVAKVRDASPENGPWPAISVWHGADDAVVSIANADAIIQQWRSLHALPEEPEIEKGEGFKRRVWRDRHGRIVLDAYVVKGLGHAVPLQTEGPDACGAEGAFMVDVGLSSTRHISRSWGIAPPSAARRAAPRAVEEAHLPDTEAVNVGGTEQAREVPRKHRGFDVGKVIEDALRTAGLMK